MFSQHTNVSNYNYKGTPVSHNSFFSPIKGIALTAEPEGNGWTRWHFIFGGTLVPVSFYKRYRDGYKP